MNKKALCRRIGALIMIMSFALPWIDFGIIEYDLFSALATDSDLIIFNQSGLAILSLFLIGLLIVWHTPIGIILEIIAFIKFFADSNQFALYKNLSYGFYIASIAFLLQMLSIKIPIKTIPETENIQSNLDKWR